MKVSAAERSIDSKEAPKVARIGLKNLLNNMDVYKLKVQELFQDIEEKLKETLYVDKLTKIKEIGLVTISGFIVEAGRYWTF